MSNNTHILVTGAAGSVGSVRDGWDDGYRQWCLKNAVDCVGNITSGSYPPVILKAHQEYLRGDDMANGTENPICPIGSDAAFCAGWSDGNGFVDRKCVNNFISGFRFCFSKKQER
jgi:hypothetical protein